ncbi:MAG: lysophospholipase [Rickettsiales bacterium]|nr:lysophospholipase [Rickettsiales bacterium]
MRVLFAAALLFVSACSPEQQAYVEKPTQVYHMEEEALSTRDGYVLPVRQWLPEGDDPLAVVVAVHGFNDYSYAFEGPGEFFSERDIAVFAYDQRGFGHTEGRGIWAGEANLVNDLRLFVEVLEKRYPDTPIFLLGESMGGAVVISAVADPSFPKVHGIILSAPALWGSEAMNPIFRGTLWLAAHTIPFRQFTGSDLKILATSNIPLLRRMAADPMVIKKTRVDAVYGVVGMMGSAYDKIPFVNVPALVLYGARDQVIPRAPVETALSRFGREVDYAYYPLGYHMLLRDLQAEVVLEDIHSWITQPDYELPSGFGNVREIKQSVRFPSPPELRR